MDMHGYVWISIWISNQVQQVGLCSHIYPLISTDMYGYPTYPYISVWSKFPDAADNESGDDDGPAKKKSLQRPAHMDGTWFMGQDLDA